MSNSFKTKTDQSRIVNVPNTEAATYVMTIEPSSGGSSVTRYVFPISPSQLDSSQRSYNTFYDTPSATNTRGVQRLIDEYGIAPPRFTVRGTTGWNALAANGYRIGGLQAFKNLERFIHTYNTLNLTARRNQEPEYKLAFMDFWYNDFWYVTPVGPVRRNQNNRRTLLLEYELELIAYESIVKEGPYETIPSLQDSSQQGSALKNFPVTVNSSLENTGVA